ncbi:MAG TPA: hypothetical protein VLH56_10165 [Dissulfurispiraceae bacterium]|nr:hypothetical protein [Dissulfurispiraceae bacterium]
MITANALTDNLFQVENGNFLFQSKMVCDFFTISRETLNNWKEQPTFPPSAITGNGLYDLKAVYQWRMTITGGQEFNERKLSAEVRTKEHKARVAEIELAQLEGSLISRDEVIARSTRQINVVKASLLTLPKQLPPALDGKDKREWSSVIFKHVETILKRFSAE